MRDARDSFESLSLSLSIFACVSHLYQLKANFGEFTMFGTQFSLSQRSRRGERQTRGEWPDDRIY